eukprot:COSAG03_NODE_27265_length_254_cov_0.664516_2_plen_28_part_01
MRVHKERFWSKKHGDWFGKDPQSRVSSS